MSSPTYHVVITPFYGVAETQQGFIDHKTIRQYGVTVGGGVTMQHTTNKRRANTRWRRIIDSISNSANAHITNMQNPGASNKTDATEFSFDVSFAKPEMPTIWVDGVVVTEQDALLELIAQALVVSSNDRVEVFDPTETQGFPKADGGVTEPNIRTGERWMQLDIGGLANSVAAAKTHITITKV
jgi:hypothetical protein